MFSAKVARSVCRSPLLQEIVDRVHEKEAWEARPSPTVGLRAETVTGRDNPGETNRETVRCPRNRMEGGSR
jgi:hypothetical protein